MSGLGAVVLLSLVPLLAASRPARGDARTWLVEATARAVERGEDSDLAGAALALRALADSGGAPEALVERFAARQNADGSFGSSGGSAPLTWLALGSLRGAARDGARAWLAERDGRGPGPDPGPADGGAPTGVDRALGFLRGGRASSDPDERSLELWTLAGGRFDVRAAYAEALAPTSDLGALASLVPAGELVTEPLHATLVGVAVLEHYRTSKEAALLAESARPVDGLRAELDARRDPATGATAGGEDGRPSVAATACALLVGATLDRWERQARRADGASPASGGPGSPAHLSSDCAGCHAGLQPAQVAQWEHSAHGREGVSCADCHGTNHSRIFRERGRVPAATCGRCHAEATEQFLASDHAHAEERLLGSALFAATPPAARDACMGCHAIGARQPDGSTGSCNHCHTGHAFAARDARRPEACTVCHTGADYPQDLAYRLSKHGALFEMGHDETTAPTCATCHYPEGTHLGGFGITIGGSGAGAALVGSSAPFHPVEITAEEFAARRSEMVGVCARCHSSRLAEASLAGADALKREGDRHVLEALRILRGLESEGVFGSGALGLGPEHARPDPALPNAGLLDAFYEMWRFHHQTAWKGAYHQSPSVANRGSGRGTHEILAFIRAEAARLRAEGSSR